MICHRCDACRKIIDGDQRRINKAQFWIPWKVESVFRADGVEYDADRYDELRMEEIELCGDCVAKMLQAVGYDKIQRMIIRDKYED